MQAPEPSNSWEGVRNAIDFGSMCAQGSLGNIVGEEDCLFLNVYTPQIVSQGAKLI